ncbi:MAG: hypothetical protein ACRDQZ_16510, partial [Mycobacteriales bacterium]
STSRARIKTVTLVGLVVRIHHLFRRRILRVSVNDPGRVDWRGGGSPGHSALPGSPPESRAAGRAGTGPLG